MRRKKFVRWLGIFFLAMLLLTVFSRVSDSVNTAQVTVKTMQNLMITHRVEGTGKVGGTIERAVFTKEGQRVEQIQVQEGQSVKRGDVLLKLSEDSLQESIEKQEEELEELKRKEQDLISAGAVNEEKKSVARSRAQENYQIAVSNGEVDIHNAQLALNQAQQKLEDYYRSLNAENSSFDEPVFTSGEEEETTPDSSTEQALKEEMRSRQELLNQAILSKNQAVLAAKREIEDANLSEASDSTLADIQRQIENTGKELEELQKLLAQCGEVKASVDGVVKSISVQTGGLTSEEAAAVLYELSGDLRMTASISEDDVKYVEIGGSVEIRGSSGKETSNARVESVREDETDSGTRILTILIPEHTLSIGETADFLISRDEGPFQTCVPLSALYGESGKEYVLVLDTEDSVLGEVQVLRKVDVSIQDKNESMAALGMGILTSNQQIVTGSDRTVQEGSRVRLKES